MNRAWRLFFAAVLVVAFVAKGDPIDSLLAIMPSSKKEMALSALNLLPSSQKKGVLEYLAITGLRVDSQSNIGFRDYNQAFMKTNPCFKDLVADFYASVRSDDLKYMAGKKAGNGYLANPSLQSQTTDLQLKPGWLWNKALEFSQGNKMLAMQLIGVCGHDDKEQLNMMQVLELSTESIAKRKSDFSDEKIRSSLNAWWKSLSKEEKDKLGPDYLHEAYTITKEQNTITTGIKCPHASSAMYYPQALGEKFDISQKLKNRIAEIQAPQQGAVVLPAKAYHVMGAAFASCHAVRGGLPDFLSKKLVSEAINSYRATRVCEKLNGFRKTEFFKKSTDEVLADAKKIRADLKHCFLAEVHGAKTYYYHRYENMKSCETALVLRTILADPDVTEEILRRKIVRHQAENDIVGMFVKSPQNKEANECKGTQTSDAVYKFLEENGTEGTANPCPKSLNAERCLAARKVMDTYAVDFEWSQAQHRAGLEFAMENCSDYNPQNNPESAACKILKKPLGQGADKDSADPAPLNGVK